MRVLKKTIFIFVCVFVNSFLQAQAQDSTNVIDIPVPSPDGDYNDRPDIEEVLRITVPHITIVINDSSALQRQMLHQTASSTTMTTSAISLGTILKTVGIGIVLLGLAALACLKAPFVLAGVLIFGIYNSLTSSRTVSEKESDTQISAHYQDPQKKVIQGKIVSEEFGKVKFTYQNGIASAITQTKEGFIRKCEATTKFQGFFRSPIKVKCEEKEAPLS